MRTGEHAIANSDESLELVARKVEPVETKICLRRKWHMSRCGTAILANSTVNLERLEEKMKTAEIVEDLIVSKLRRDDAVQSSLFRCRS